ncbi:MAG: redoxin family protein [Chloroherpetonaceae bacterium]|nr:redoxin family protein [Chthonomonadaceae bacterium]MDW8207791.1 redoxin family protein [Chloroherpetonaceae bacterium]
MKQQSFPVVPAIVLAWGAVTIGAFWHMVARYLRPVEPPAGAATLYPEQAPRSPVTVLHTDQGPVSLRGPMPVTLLNFWSPDCPCSRFMEGHVRRLVATHAEQVRFITVVEGNPGSEADTLIEKWRQRGISAPAATDPDGAIARAFGVWAAPAAVVLDVRGRVVFVGAYNAARYCDDPRTAFAAQALNAVLHGEQVPRPRTPFYGCQVLPAR